MFRKKYGNGIFFVYRFRIAISYNACSCDKVYHHKKAAPEMTSNNAEYHMPITSKMLVNYFTGISYVGRGSVSIYA